MVLVDLKLPESQSDTNNLFGNFGGEVAEVETQKCIMFLGVLKNSFGLYDP